MIPHPTPSRQGDGRFCNTTVKLRHTGSQGLIYRLDGGFFKRFPSGRRFFPGFSRRRRVFYLTPPRALLLHAGVQPAGKFCEGCSGLAGNFGGDWRAGSKWLTRMEQDDMGSERKSPGGRSGSDGERNGGTDPSACGLRMTQGGGVILSTRPRHSERSEESVSFVSLVPSASPVNSGYRSRQVGFSRSTSSFFRLRRHPFSAFSRLMAS